jgi:cyclic pyranopterin phosphate synthase
MAEFTHFNAEGEAHMVNVGDKPSTHRRAIAEGRITMHHRTLQLILSGGHKKGDVLGVARIAGIMAAKRAPELIPLCHPLSLTRIEINLNHEEENNAIHCCSQVETVGQTGVEIEAMCATQIALLTIYDMCKAADRGMVISDIRLLEKRGGKSGIWKQTD